jgi:hypothetical protein
MLMRCAVLRRIKTVEGNIMRSVLSVFTLVASVSLTACQTASTINGVSLPVRTAQGGDTFCERNFVLCIAGGALVAGGAAAAATGGHRGDPPSGSTGGSGSGSLSGGNRPRTAIP